MEPRIIVLCVLRDFIGLRDGRHSHQRDNEFSQPRSGMLCHPERSEGSHSMGTEILRCAQDDSAGLILRGVYPERSEGLRMTGPALIVTIHHRAAMQDSRKIFMYVIVSPSARKRNNYCCMIFFVTLFVTFSRQTPGTMKCREDPMANESVRTTVPPQTGGYVGQYAQGC